MKGFDEHLDNYGDPNPGHEPFYAESWDGPGDDFDYDPDIPDERETAEILNYDDGITTDSFDNWPGRREFPS